MARTTVVVGLLSMAMTLGIVLGWFVARGASEPLVSESSLAALPPRLAAVSASPLVAAPEAPQALHVSSEPVENATENLNELNEKAVNAPEPMARSAALSPSPTVSNESLADLIERVEPSIVRVNVFGRQSSGHGSGFVVDKRGLVVTNFHVIAEATRAEVVFKDGQTAPVRGTLAALESHDLAVLKIDCPVERLHPIAVASAVPRKGDRVAAFGAPLGFSFTTSDGLVSAVRSGRELDNEFRSLGMPLDNDPRLTWVQTTAPISRGNSGGPLVNMQGEVVGVNTLSVPMIGQNLNFAVSSLDVLSTLKLAAGDVRPLEPRGKPMNPTAGPTPRPRDAIGEIVDGRSTAEGRRLLASLKKVKIVVSAPEAPPALSGSIGAALEQAAGRLQKSLREAGLKVTDTADAETGLAVVTLRCGFKAARTIDSQLELAVLRPNAGGGQRQLVMLWSEASHESFPLAQAADPSRLAPRLDRRIVALADAFSAARQNAQ
jgi:S1-C subfamily serine protease